MHLGMQPLYDRYKNSIYFVFIALWAVLLLRHAWVAEDAFITFRSLDNFVSGYGLRWNIAERVQAFTNPLWLFLHVPFYAVWRNVDFITIALSLICAVLTVVLTIRALRLSPWAAGVFLLVPFLLSKTLTEYSFSGLENPLTTLLFAAFAYVLWSEAEKPQWFRLSFLVALSLVNRLDMALIYIPVMTYLLVEYRRSVDWKALLKGSWPIVAWLVFSLFYYGFIFPNTKYAKLNTSASEAKYLILGVEYVINFLVMDPLMALLIPCSFFLTLCSVFLLPAEGLKARKDMMLFTLAVGMSGYFLYVVLVGGSFVSCRYMSLPGFMALWILLAFFSNHPVTPRCRVALVLAVCACAFAGESKLFNRLQNSLIARMHDPLKAHGKGHFYGSAFGPDIRTHDWAGLLNMTRAEHERRGPQMRVTGAVGVRAYYENREVYWVDTCGLGNALLARLPSSRFTLIGHAEREVPPGYILALQTGETHNMQADLAEYYTALWVIVGGDLMSFERLKIIARFNLGYYDDLRRGYLASLKR